MEEVLTPKQIYNTMTLTDFITTPLGVVCVGIVSSIVGAGIYKIGERLYMKAHKQIRYKRFIKSLASIGEMYCNGYTAAYAKHKSHFHQVLHVNHFAIKLIKNCLTIILVCFVAIGLLILFQEIVIIRPIIIAFACVIVAIEYKKVKALYETYQIMFDHEFGEEYEKRMTEGMEGYWDSIVGEQSRRKEE